MMLRSVFAAVFLAGLTAIAMPAHSQKQSLGMLDELDQGGWELRERGGAARNICLDSGRRLIQLRHPGAACSSVVIQDVPNEVTVQYTCRGQGYGRTHIRRETNRLIQLDSQGIVNGVPFTVSAEGRKTGACGGS